MRRSLVLLAACASCVATPALADSWRVVGQAGAAPGRMVHLVDTDSIVRQGDAVTFSSMTIWEERAPDSEFDKSITERKGDCVAKSSAIVSMSTYAEGRFLDTEYGTGEVIAHGPNSTARALLDSACGVRGYATEPLPDPEASVRGNFARTR